MAIDFLFLTSVVYNFQSWSRIAYGIRTVDMLYTEKNTRMHVFEDNKTFFQHHTYQHKGRFLQQLYNTYI